MQRQDQRHKLQQPKAEKIDQVLKHTCTAPLPLALLTYQSKCQLVYRSEGFLNWIFHPCALWARDLARWESCRRVAVAVAVIVIWKFSSTFRPGNYIWSLSYGFGFVVREIFENGDRGSTQNFDTNLLSIVVWPGEPF